MSRTARVVLPNHPHHVVQRGHNRDTVFARPEDFRYYLATLRAFKDVFDVKLQGYCLMSNHVHLILQPGDDPAGLGRLMKRLAGRQTRYLNRREGRSGTLWESRYKSSPIETDRYLLACCRYVELNPVRAGMAGSADAYPWSSYRQRVGLEQDDLLDLDPVFEALGDTVAKRRHAYVAFVNDAIAPGEWDLIREAANRERLTGDSGFIDRVEALTGFRIKRRGPGRPPRSAAAEGSPRAPEK